MYPIMPKNLFNFPLVSGEKILLDAKNVNQHFHSQ